MGVKQGTVKSGRVARVKRQQFDFWIFICILVLLALGSIMVFSSSAAYAYTHMGGDTYFFLKKQLLWVAVGLVAMLVMANFDYRKLGKLSPLMMVVSVVLMIITAIPGIGTYRNGARRWLEFGGFSLQPSEIMKITFILFMAWILSKRTKKMESFWKDFIPYILITGLVAGTCVLQKHMSCFMIFVVVAAVMIFFAGAKIKHYLMLLPAAVPAIVLLASKMEHIQVRILGFLDPFSGGGESWQIKQSLLAIGSGGLFGKGIGRSMQKYLYLPEPYNDFIFSILAEELGFVGVAAVLTLFILLLWRGFKVANHAPDKFGSLLAAGITTLIGFQVIVNIAVVTSSMPVTGMPLPFFSYGGTSLVFLMADMGILLNVSRYANYERI